MNNSILTNSFGKLETFGQNYVRKFRLIYIIGYCPSNVPASSVVLLQHNEHSAEWSTGIQDVSKVDRYIVATPKLTSSGRISSTSKIIKMCPNAGSVNKHFQKMSFDDWLKDLSLLVSERSSHPTPAIATKEFWLFENEVQA